MDPVEQQYMDALFSRFNDSTPSASTDDFLPSQGPWPSREEPGNEPAWLLKDSTATDYISSLVSGLGVGVGAGDFGIRPPSWPSSPASTFGVTSMLWSSDSDSPTCIKENAGKAPDVPPIDLLSEQWSPEDVGVPSALQRHLEDSLAWAFKNKRE